MKRLIVPRSRRTTYGTVRPSSVVVVRDVSRERPGRQGRGTRRRSCGSGSRPRGRSVQSLLQPIVGVAGFPGVWKSRMPIAGLVVDLREPEPGLRLRLADERLLLRAGEDRPGHRVVHERELGLGPTVPAAVRVGGERVRAEAQPGDHAGECAGRVVALERRR